MQEKNGVFFEKSAREEEKKRDGSENERKKEKWNGKVREGDGEGLEKQREKWGMARTRDGKKV